MMIMMVSMLGSLTGCNMLTKDADTEISDNKDKDNNSKKDKEDEKDNKNNKEKELPSADELMSSINDNFENYNMDMVFKASGKLDDFSMVLNITMTAQVSENASHTETVINLTTSEDGETLKETVEAEVYTTIDEDWCIRYQKSWENEDDKASAEWVKTKEVYVEEDDATNITPDMLSKVANATVEKDDDFYVVTGELTSEDFEALIAEMGLEEVTGFTTTCTAKFNADDKSFHSIDIEFNCSEKVDYDGLMLNIKKFEISLEATNETVTVPSAVVKSAEKNDNSDPEPTSTLTQDQGNNDDDPTVDVPVVASDWYVNEKAVLDFLANYDFSKYATTNNVSLMKISMNTNDWKNYVNIELYEHVYENIIYAYNDYSIDTEELREETIDVTYTVINGNEQITYSATQERNGEGETTATDWVKTTASIEESDYSIMSQYAFENIDYIGAYEGTFKGLDIVNVYGDLSAEATDFLCSDFPFGDPTGAEGSVELFFTPEGTLLYSEIRIEIPQAQVEGLNYTFTDVDYTIATDYYAIDALRIPDYVLRETGDLTDSAPEWVEDDTYGQWERTGELEWEQESGMVTIFLNGKDNWYYDNSWSWVELLVDDPAVNPDGAYEVQYDQVYKEISEMTNDDLLEEIAGYGSKATINDVMTFTCNGRTCYYYVDTQWKYWKDVFVLQDIGGKNFLKIEIRINDEDMTNEEAHTNALKYIEMFVLNL